MAARLADDSGAAVINVGHMLRALVQTPTPGMEKVLKDVVDAPVPPRATSSWLNANAIELTKNLGLVNCGTPEMRALVDALGQARRSVLLVAQDNEEARTVARSAAAALKGRRILGLSWPPCEMPPQACVVRALGEATAEDVILLMPDMTDWLGPCADAPWSEQVLDTLRRRAVQLICPMRADQAEAWLAANPRFRRLMQVIWVHSQRADEIPSHL